VSNSRVYGDAVANSLRLGNAPTLVTRSLTGSQVGISRLSIGPEQLGMTARIPSEDTFIAAIYLTAVRHHELWRGGKPHICQGYAPNAMRVVNLVDSFSANIKYPHETLVFYIPRSVLDDITAQAGGRPIRTLNCTPGIIDPVVVRLTESLLPAFERPQEISGLFIDYVTQALCIHFAHHYGGFQPAAQFLKGGLSPRQTERAHAFLRAHHAENITLSDVALSCDLSPSYFIKAFKRTTGITPHQWLLRHRIERAQTMMLETETPLGEIAVACGFADQSHLTRVFKLAVGDSPGAWRRQRQF
jgi:AraC family transcriptional regulator